MKKNILTILLTCAIIFSFGCEKPEEKVYSLNQTSVGVALSTTVSGNDNSLMTSYDLTLSDQDGNAVAEDIAWSSDNDSVVTVDNGKLTAVAEGETTVKAVYKGITYECKVTVGTAIATRDDFITLAVASYKSETHELLAKTYVLVNDIDYTEKIFYPIAGVSLDGKFAPYKYTGEYRFYTDSLQWKELLSTRFNDFDWSHFSRSGINPTGVPFSGVIEGNGFTIKNASFMADNCITNAWDRLGGAWNNVIGRLTGKIRNIFFEDLAYQEFRNGSCGVNIVNTYTNYAFENGLKFGNPDFKPGATPINVANMQTFSGLVYENKGEIENLYIKVWRPEITSLGSAYGCIGGVAVLNYGKINNVVVEHPITPGRLPSVICGSLVENGSLENCFAIVGSIEDSNRSLVYGLEDSDSALSTCKIFTDLNGFLSSSDAQRLDKNIWNIQQRALLLNKK